MKWTVAALIMVGLIAAASAAVLAVTLKTDFGRSSASQQPQEMTILVATRALPANSMIDSTAIAQETVKRLPEYEKSFSNPSQIIGRVLVAPVLQGQPFITPMFASSDSPQQVVSAIPEGSRAMAIMLSDETGIEDLLYPGSIVDVVASFRLPAPGGGSSAEVVSVTLLQGLKVLAAGGRTIMSDRKEDAAAQIDPTGRRGRMITLMVNTAQAEALQLAATHGKVSVSLRNPLDQARANVSGTRMSELNKDLAERIRKLAEQEIGALPQMPVAVKATDMADAGSTEPGKAATGASPTATSPAPAAQPAKNPLWTTVILRGRTAEEKKFEILPDEGGLH